MAQYLDLEGAKVIVNKIKEGDNKTYVQKFSSGSGKNGYMSIALITIKDRYLNQPIEIKITQRSSFGTIIIMFSNLDTTDPNLAYIKKIGNINAYIVRKSAGMWELYVKKIESYDVIDVLELYKGGYMDKVDVKWNDGFVESLPAGCSEAKLLDLDTYGNSATATKLATARTIALSGSVTGSGSFDGSGNLSIATTTNHTHTKSQITDMPTSLKNPTALTVQFNGTTDKTYDGSSAQTVNITPGGIGAYTKGEVDNKITPLNNNVNQLSNTNLLINGDFQVWQRGTTFNYSSTNKNIYTADRWRLIQSADGSTCTITKNVQGRGLTITGFSKKANIEMALSQITGVPFDKEFTKDYTLSVAYSSDLNAELQIRDVADRSKPIILSSAKMAISPGVKVVYISFPASKLKSNSLLEAYVSFYGEDYVNKTINLFYIKLEPGNLATPYVSNTYAEEFNACQRYYQTHVASGVANTTKVLGINSRYPTTMRVKPTLTFKEDIIHEHGKGTIGKNTLFDDYSALEDRIDYMAIKTKEMFTVGKTYNVQGICLDAEIY